MSKYLAGIIKYLDSEKDLYLRLLNLAEEKKNAIIASDLDSLDEIVCTEEDILAELKQTEDQRADLTQEMADAYGLKAEDIVVSKWPEKLTAENTNRIKQLQADLKQLLADLDIKNQLNARLIEIHLSYIDFIFDTATSTQENTTYSAAGNLEAKKEQATNLFDETM